MSTELDKIIEQYMESERKCNKSRKIYSELEHILIKKHFLEGAEGTASRISEAKVNDAAPNPSHRVGKKDSTASSASKMKSNISDKSISFKQHQLSSASDKNCFVALQKVMFQFENYKNILSQDPNKYASEFLNLLEMQNSELSTKLFENESENL